MINYFRSKSILSAIDNDRENAPTKQVVTDYPDIPDTELCNINKTIEPSPPPSERVSSSKKLSNLLSPQITDTTASKKRKFSFPTTSTYATNSKASCYFSQQKSIEASKTPKSTLGKARVSGLLKDKKCHQKNLIQMWSKNS